MAVEVLTEKIDQLRRDFDEEKQENRQDHIEFRQGIKDIIQIYANRPPTWATCLISFLCFIAGILATLVVK